MSNVFKCWSWKKKNKKNERQRSNSIISVNAGPELREIFNDYKKVKAQDTKPPYKRRSESLSNDPAYLQRLFGLKQDMKVRSYPTSPVRQSQRDNDYLSDQKPPTSPVRQSQRDKDYLSDHKQKRIIVEGRDIPYKKQSPRVYAASVPQNTSYFHKPIIETSNEPFPYQVPVDNTPRKSSLFYGVRYADDDSLDERKSIKYTAEKPIENYDVPSTSQAKYLTPPTIHRKEYDNENIPESGRRVTIQTNNIDDQNLLYVDENEAAPVRTTVVRFRPHSAGSSAPRESVKLMSLRADQVQHPSTTPTVRVHQIPFKPSRHASILTTSDGRRLQPVETDKIRRMSVQSEREIQPVRVSVVEPTTEVDNVRRLSTGPIRESVVYAAPVIQTRKSVRRPSVRQSILHRDNVDGKRYSVVREENIKPGEDQPFPLREGQNVPLVYAVPVVPTRGRTKSILQQSVKSLSSKYQGEPTIHKKNIRYSMDTDVFSADVRRRSVAPPPPGYVNMEKGHPMLVSDVLNPITSLFVSDLKDNVPKDPLSKPKEANVWVKPRRYSGQRQSAVKKPQKPPPVQIVYQDPMPKGRAVSVQRRQSRVHYKYKDQSSSSSDESVEVYRKKSRKSAHKKPYYQHAVYAAQMPSVTLPIHETEKGKGPIIKKKGKPVEATLQPSASKDFCGLNCETPAETNITQAIHNVQMVSSTQQTDIEDEEMDLLCYPSEKFLKTTALAAGSGSKLRWRIIIKRGEEK